MAVYEVYIISRGLLPSNLYLKLRIVESRLKDSSKAEILCYCFDSVLDYAHIGFPEHIFSPLKKYLVLYCLRIILEICYCFIKGRLNSCIRDDC